ncbi:hypothetical protein BY458DRAFT_453462 [Sporodiniella umbellata]|nr:hypothetical protein BY458DRAFT_453462 [Sporodiniella umbellata]
MDGLVELANNTFHLFRCSPFYNFENDTRPSRNKPGSLALFICSELQLSLSHRKEIRGSRGELKDIRFENLAMPEIDFYSSQVQPLKITIDLKFAKDRLDTQHVFILIPAVVHPTQNSSFTYYPLMLVRSKDLVRTVVLEWFKTNYTCQISTLFINVAVFHSVIKGWIGTLLDLVPLEDELIQAPMKNVQHRFELDYVIHGCEQLSNVSVKLSTAEATKLCKKLTHQQDFVFVLQDHVFQATKLHVDALPIGRLKTTDMMLDRSGRLKFFGHISRKEASKVVNELIELASTK